MKPPVRDRSLVRIERCVGLVAALALEVRLRILPYFAIVRIHEPCWASPEVLAIAITLGSSRCTALMKLSPPRLAASQLRSTSSTGME